MSGSEDRADELRKVWQASDRHLENEDNTMTLKIAREKQRSLFDFVRQQNMQTYLISFSFAPLTAMAAWKGSRSIWLLCGYLLMTTTLTIGAGVVWLHARMTMRREQLDLSRREHQRQLLQFQDAVIRFWESTKYWYAVPLLVGAGLAGYPILTYLFSRAWAAVAVLALLIGLWLGMCRHNANVLTDLRNRRQDLQQLLEEMNRD